MTEITADAPEAQTTVGGLLRAARLRAGGELAQIGRDLRIKPIYLEALEEGRPQDLPGRAYAIGFLRTYADYLNLDVGECLGRFKSEFPSGAAAEAATASPSSSTYRVEDDVRLPHGTILIFLTLIGIAIYGGWYLFRSANEVLETRVKPVPDSLIAAPQTAPAPPAPATVQSDPLFAPDESEFTAPSPVFEPPAESGTAGPETPGAVESAVQNPAQTPVEKGLPAAEAEIAEEAASATQPASPGVDPNLILDAQREPETASEPAAQVPNAQAPTEIAPVETAALPEAQPEAPGAEPSDAAPRGPDFGAVVAQAGRTFGAPTRDNRVVLRAKEEVFVRVETDGPSGLVLFEGMLQPGELYFVPVRPNVVLVTRDGGAVEVFLDRVSRGDAGPSGVALKGLPLDPEGIGH